MTDLITALSLGCLFAGFFLTLAIGVYVGFMAAWSLALRQAERGYDDDLAAAYDRGHRDGLCQRDATVAATYEGIVGVLTAPIDASRSRFGGWWN